MEIYEKKHLFDAMLNLAKYLCWLVLGIALLRTGPDAWWRYPDWAWWVAVAMAVLLIIAPMPFLWVKVNRYLAFHVYKNPAVIIDKDYLQICTSPDEYNVILWNEVVDFKILPGSKDRNMCYPIYKDDSRNSRGIGMQFHHDVIYCDHLTISELELLEELKKHIIR